jgi:acyl-CoA thioesterase II
MSSLPVQANTLSEQIAVVQTGDDEFTSVLPPGRMGNRAAISYGGCTTAVAILAASKTVRENFNLYSCVGYFLGPASIDRPVKCNIFRSRDTRSFATRRILLSQKLPNGTERNCMEILADYQNAEPASFMDFSPRTILSGRAPEECPEVGVLRDQYVADGKLSKERGALLDENFALMGRFFEQRMCTEGVTGQSVAGFAKDVPTTQDHLDITEKFSAEWFRARETLNSKAEQWAALAFNMDGGLSFLPLMHDHKFLEDVGACSSLDFSLRLFTPNLNMNNWHIKERKAIAGEGARTYSEARLFDAAGNLVAIESQQSIMRPPPIKDAKL